MKNFKTLLEPLGWAVLSENQTNDFHTLNFIHSEKDLRIVRSLIDKNGRDILIMSRHFDICDNWQSENDALKRLKNLLEGNGNERHN